MQKLLIGNLIAILTFAGCKKDDIRQKGPEDKIVVSYKDHFLTHDDILAVLPADVSKEDSVKLTDSFIKKWVEKKVVLDEARNNIGEDDMREIENKVIEYKQDLLINAFNNYLIENSLNDSISESELDEYYENNKKSFPLNYDLVQVSSVTLNKEDEEEGDRLFNSGEDEDFFLLLTLDGSGNGEENDSVWLAADKLKISFPELAENVNWRTLVNKRKIKLEDAFSVTYIKMHKLYNKGNTAPYNFVKPTIKELLINKRKLNLLTDLQNSLYKEALNNNEIKINEN